jgi:cytoskeletal protein CcmA (bactofilin family)
MLFGQKKDKSIDVAPKQLPGLTLTTERNDTLPMKMNLPPAIGKHVRINGDIDFEGELRIEGLINGNISSSDPNAHLIVEKGAEIDGDVNASTVELRGIIRGSVESNGLLTVNTSGRIDGSVKYNQLTLERGGVINGSLESVFGEAAPFDQAHDEQPRVD